MSTTRPWIPPRKPQSAPDFPMVETTVPAPSEIPEIIPPGKFQRLAPLLMVIAVVGMIGIMAATGARKLMSSPLMLMFPLMMIMSAGGMIGGHAGSGGKKTPEINAERRKYLQMLTNLRKTVHERAAAQYAFLAHSAPPKDAVAALVGGPRQWELSNPERERTNFLAVRVGVGDLQLGGGLTMAESAPKEDLEPVQRVAGERFFRAHRAVHGMPVKIDLKTHQSVQFFGEGDLDGVIRSMLIQLALFHPPTLLAIAVITEEPEKWGNIKWMPHNRNPFRVDDLGGERMVYTPEQARAGLADLLAGRGGFSADSSYTGDKPWLIVVADGVGEIPGCGESTEAVTVIRRGGRDETGLLPTLGARVEVAADGSARKRRSSPDDELRRWVSKLDTVTEAEFRRVAVRMARWRSAGAGTADLGGFGGGAGERTWASLHNIDDLGAVGTTLWTGHRDRDPDRMKVPIGWDRSGAPVNMILREMSEGGWGSHGLILGTSGSGKSSFVASLIAGLCLLHTPDELTIVAIDYKGDGTFPGFENLNHFVTVLSNIGDPHYINRLEDVLRGEVVRRQRLRAATGRYKDAATYLRARERGVDLPAFPMLLIVCDEFTALLEDHPEFKKVFEYLGQQGRSDRIGLVLATQSLTGVALGQLESNLHWKICLKTANTNDSIAAIQTKDAAFLDGVGEGYYKVGGADPKWFQAAHPYEPYFAPAAGAVRQAAEEAASGAASSGVARFGVEPLGEVRSTVIDTSADEAPVVRTAEEVDNAPDGLSVLLDQLAGKGTPPYKMWLPEMVAPNPVGQLVAASGLKAGDQAVLQLPIGLMDLPFKHEQALYVVDLTESHLAVVGKPRSGKSVALQTLAIAAAELNDSRRVQIYGIDCGADSKLLALEDLPHVGGVAMKGAEDAVNRVLAEIEEVVRRRTAMFRQMRIGSMAAYRQMVAAGTAEDDGLGDVILLLDGWDGFRADRPEAEMGRFAALLQAGTAVGVHVVVTALRWNSFPNAVGSMFNTSIELKINDPHMSKTGSKRLADGVPANIPGRGLDIASEQNIMIGAPRLDDVAAVDDAGLAAAVAQIAARSTGRARAVRLLPDRLLNTDLQLPADWAGSSWSVPVGLRESDLGPAVLDFMADRNLNVFGGKDCGKTHLLASIAEDLMARYTPDQVRFMVVDLKGSQLADAIPDEYLLRWRDAAGVARNGLVLSKTDLTVAVAALGNFMAARMPTGDLTREQRRNRSWWSGPEVVVLVDDYAMVHNADPMAFAALAPFWGNAASVGVHAVVACPISMALKVLNSGTSLMSLNAVSSGATLVMDGVKDHAPGGIAGVKPVPRQPGRGVLVQAGVAETIQTPVAAGLDDGTCLPS